MPITRRTFLQTSALTAAAAFVGVTKAGASFVGLVDTMMKEARTAKVTVTKVRDNLYVIENTGGNITVFDGPDGKLMIDTGITGSHPQIIEALASISAAPLKEVINTHWHFDHTGGNPWLHETGARLTAHKNTRKHMTVPTTVAPWNYTFPPTPASGLPTNLLEHDTVMPWNNTHLSIQHIPHAHTDGDLMVRFEEADVITTGDTFWNGYYPFIDCGTGGDVAGIIKATRHNLSVATDKTAIIPGHGPIATKAQLQEYCDMLVTIRNSVMRMKREHMPVADVIAKKPTAAYDAKWGNYAVSPDDFVALVYQSVCCEETNP